MRHLWLTVLVACGSDEPRATDLIPCETTWQTADGAVHGIALCARACAAGPSQYVHTDDVCYWVDRMGRELQSISVVVTADGIRGVCEIPTDCSDPVLFAECQ